MEPVPKTLFSLLDREVRGKDLACQTCLYTGAALIKMPQGRVKPGGTPTISLHCSRVTEKAEVKRIMNLNYRVRLCPTNKQQQKQGKSVKTKFKPLSLLDFLISQITAYFWT